MKYKHDKGVFLSLTEQILLILATIVVVTFLVALFMAYYNTKPGVSLTQFVIAGARE